MTVKIKDVAKHVGVSEATVSLALNGSSLVNEKTREKIEKAAKFMGYVPNPYARKLVLKKSGTIGLVVPDILNPFYAAFVAEVNKCIQDSGYSLTIAISENSPEYEEKLVQDIVYSRIEGLIYVPIHVRSESKSHRDFIQKVDIPVVCATTKFMNLPSIYSDFFKASYDLTNYLISKGYKRFGYFSDALGSHSVDMRLNGFKIALKEAGMEIDDSAFYFTEPGFREGEKAIAKVVADIAKYDVVVCVNDMLALGLMNELYRDGVRVPDDVAITGFDDIIFSRVAPVPITTVRQNIQKIAQEAFRMICDKLANDANDLTPITIIETELVPRDSTR